MEGSGQQGRFTLRFEATTLTKMREEFLCIFCEEDVWKEVKSN